MKKIVVLIFLLAGLGWSQLTIETTLTSDGFFGQGAFESTTKTRIQGELKRQESQFQFTGGILKHMNKKGSEIEITRLDRDVIWTFNDQNNKYTELSFAELKGQYEQGMENLGYPGMEELPEAETEPSDSDYEWQKPVIRVEKMGNEKISGIDCTHHLITVTTVGKHKATGVLDTLLVHSDVWHSKDYKDALAIEREFNSRYMEKLGFSHDGNKGLARLTHMYGEQMSDYEDEMKKLDGLPIKTVLKVTSTQHAKGETAESDESQEESDVAVPDLRKGIGGMFGKKVAEMAKSKTQKPKNESGRSTIFSSTTLVTSIDLGPIDGSEFQVPAEYKLQKK
ncbi:hypothetical protein JW992_03430 [candidate division KSB1 bacterium]|nr:hypothetical protein [candidate division KSB1 bacterium]